MRKQPQWQTGELDRGILEKYMDNFVQKNPKLARTAVDLHQNHQINSNTYIIDLDTVEHNANVIKKEADNHNISLYFMSKQIGRNPIVCKVIGWKTVAVDVQEVKSLNRYGIPIGHVGHLVQIPVHEIEYVLNINSEVWTVYSVENARLISKFASKLEKTQELLVQPVGREDKFYPTMEGGILEENLIEAVKSMDKMKNIEVVGVTTFPALFYHMESGKVEPTPNFYTIMRAASVLKDKLGIEIKQINAPGNNSADTMALVKEMGATHAEPGSSVCGVSPQNAFHPDSQPEIPAICYITEVSHFFRGKAWVYGGGFWPDTGMVDYYGGWLPDKAQFPLGALVSRSSENILENRIPVEPLSGGELDYYLRLCPKSRADVNVGDTVIFSFRPQIFVTRAHVAIVRGIQKGEPELLGIFDHANNLINRNGVTSGTEAVKELLRSL